MMIEIEFTTEPIDSIDTIESIMDNYLEQSINSINSVDELLNSLSRYLDDTNYNPEFNLNNVNFNIDDLYDLYFLLTGSYMGNLELDSKTEFITNIIRLVLTNKMIEHCGAFYS